MNRLGLAQVTLTRAQLTDLHALVRSWAHERGELETYPVHCLLEALEPSRAFPEVTE